MAHTAGDWKAREDYGRWWIVKTNGARSIQIADVSAIEIGVGTGEVDTDAETTRANAMLIAAAPKMFAACEIALKGVLDPEARKLIKAAIAKAKGN